MTLPLSVPHLAGNERAYLEECLATNWVSSAGPFVTRMERLVAERVGAPHAVATASGTAALHVALLVAGVLPDDLVLVSDLTFIAPANAVRYAGAWPVTVDAEPAYWQMDPARAAEYLERECERRDGVTVEKGSGRRVRAILPVHVLGHPCDLEPLSELARRHGLALVEDASESLGTLYRGRPTGSLGDIACFSFNGNKIVTSGGGGMIVTRRADWAERARYLTTQARDDAVEYVHGAIGYNYRLTNLQAAVGCAQLEQLDGFVERKRAIARRYAEGLSGTLGLELPREASWARSTFWLYTVGVDPARFGMTSRELLARLARGGIESRPVWAPVSSNAPHRGCRTAGGEVAQELHRRLLSLPSSVGLTEADQARVIAAVRAAALETRRV